MKKIIYSFAFVTATLLFYSNAQAQEDKNTQADYETRLKTIKENLHPKTGTVKLASANVTLSLGDKYYYLNSKDTEKVLHEVWGNPLESSRNTLGMIFEKEASIDNASWGAVITFSPSGFVSDADSKTADYDALLTELRADEAEVNQERAKLGYAAVHLVGWAQRPFYDPQNHSLVWARNIKFADSDENTLNYDIRVLGRRGYLSLNMVASMSELQQVRDAASQLAAVAKYDAGNRYEDYNASTDKTAEYGLLGLVAAGTGAAAAKKLGFLAVLLAFGKKFIVIIGVALAGFLSQLTKFFRRRS